MFCMSCGTELSDTAKFCTKCGMQVGFTPQKKNVSQEKDVSEHTVLRENNTEDRLAPKAIQKNTLMDGLTDKLAGKIRGQKVETIRISLDDMLRLLQTHFIDPAETDEDYKNIQKAVSGGVWGSMRLASKDGNYKIIMDNAFALGGRLDLLHPGDSSWFIIDDYTTGKRYQYNAVTLSKFKKAATKMIIEAQTRS